MLTFRVFLESILKSLSTILNSLPPFSMYIIQKGNRVHPSKNTLHWPKNYFQLRTFGKQQIQKGHHNLPLSFLEA